MVRIRLASQAVRRSGHAAILAACCVAGLACTTASMPRSSTPIPHERFLEVGAMADASRGFPVAFYANPGAAPETVDVEVGLGTTRVHAGQWLADLARAMNVALAQVSRFDERFLPVSQQVFAHDIEDGDRVYKWREPAGGIDVGKARVARLRLVELKSGGSTNEGQTAQIVVEVSVGDSVRMYACEKSALKWELEAFVCAGEKILGDPKFWQAVALAP